MIRRNDATTSDTPVKISQVVMGRVKLAARRMPEVKAMESQRRGMES